MEIYITKHARIASVDPRAVGRRIREIRGFDLSQAEFGKVLGVSQNTVSLYESGKVAPTLNVLVRLKAHSGRSIDWIVEGEEKTVS